MHRRLPGNFQRTSLSVEPAASFLNYFSGKNLVVINRDPTPADSRVSLLLHEDVEKVFREMEGEAGDRSLP